MFKHGKPAIVLISCLHLIACSDTPSAQQADTGSSSLAAAWAPPRTPWGDPDLQGQWPLDSLSGTSFERPVAFGEQAFLTEEQYAARVEQQAERAGAYDREDQEDRIGGGHWFEWNAPPLRQTSLIVEPANGRIPPMTEKGAALAVAMKSSWTEEVFTDIGDFNPLDRRITRGLPASMIPFPYNNGLQIVQSPGYVVMNHELIHETRIIPLDARPPLSDAIQPWLGSSRGHWEGDTLVIETGNFNGLSPMNIVAGPNGVPTSTSLHIMERLTLTGPDTIQYEAFVEDPEMLTAPWKMAFPLTRNENYGMFEYACHEGNTVVDAYIRATNEQFHLENAAPPSTAN